MEVAYSNYLTSSLNIYIGKTPVPNSNTLFSHPSVNRWLDGAPELGTKVLPIYIFKLPAK